MANQVEQAYYKLIEIMSVLFIRHFSCLENRSLLDDLSYELIEMSTYHKIDLIVYYHNEIQVYNNLPALKDSILAYKTL